MRIRLQLLWSGLSPEVIKKKAFSDKRAKLQYVEDSVLASGQSQENSQTKAEKATYIQQLTAKILDNLEVTLTNIHIRFYFPTYFGLNNALLH